MLVPPETLALGLGTLGADPQPGAEAPKPAQTPAPIPEPRRFMSKHEGNFGGRRIAYTVTAGDIYLKDAASKPRAAIFSFSYVKEGERDPARRPVTFVFNGGPGSASLWLHMGCFGPKRIVVPDDATAAGTAPYPVVDNTLSALDATDLVFIDPVGTGYSQALGEAKVEEFWGLESDAIAIAEFIKLWLTQHKRWASPRYLAGESYGTTRAIAVAGKLQSGLSGVPMNGLALISVIIDFHTARFEKGNLLPDVSFLPTYAATALYHRRIKLDGKSRKEFLDGVRQFAIEDYAPALLQGSRLDPTRRRRLARRLAEITGLSERWLEGTNLRIDASRFRKELLREDGVTVGRLDARYRGRDYDNVGELPDADPSGYAIDGAYTSAVNDYLTRGLEIAIDKPYVSFNMEALKKWDWYGTKDDKAPRWPGYVNLAPELGRLQREIPALRVLMANGLYDLATPFFAVENTIAGSGIDRERVAMAYYEAGHMMYVHEPSLKQLHADFRRLLAPASKRAPTAKRRRRRG
ncbi:MAG: peptidase S10 [Proteobacteria bacterium]|nr:peptidase S10 [Pseudomonadota bacterium]MBI3497315.1 peptidase S10 [Pseudomonadota bacterium]